MSAHPCPDFVCPACAGALDYSNEQYHCTDCDRRYPVLFGIADFRLQSDRYLTLEQERDKARRLYEYGLQHSFEELLAYYYEITDDVPPELAQRYQAYILNAPQQAQTVLQQLQLTGDERLLDVGCGAGGLLVAAHDRVRRVVGVDIALRWLVICQKRLQQQQADALLVCADAEQLPFAANRFDRIVLADVIEHVRDPQQLLAQAASQLPAGGRMWLSASNRYCLGPHPLTRIWGIGYLPRAWRRRVLLWLRGVDSLRYTRLVSPVAVRRWCRQAGFGRISSQPRQIYIEDMTAYPIQDRILIRLYRYLLQFVLFRLVLLYVGPAFEMNCDK